MDHELDEVTDVDGLSEQHEALLLAIAAAATRRGLTSPASLQNPRPVLADLTVGGRPGHCDVCDTPAHHLAEMYAQYVHVVFRARICARCRRSAPRLTAYSES
jgi:hypothetical protein